MLPCIVNLSPFVHLGGSLAPSSGNMKDELKCSESNCINLQKHECFNLKKKPQLYSKRDHLVLYNPFIL